MGIYPASPRRVGNLDEQCFWCQSTIFGSLLRTSFHPPLPCVKKLLPFSRAGFRVILTVSFSSLLQADLGLVLLNCHSTCFRPLFSVYVSGPLESEFLGNRKHGYSVAQLLAYSGFMRAALLGGLMDWVGRWAQHAADKTDTLDLHITEVGISFTFIRNKCSTMLSSTPHGPFSFSSIFSLIIEIRVQRSSFPLR